jgi:hypothetical protein
MFHGKNDATELLLSCCCPSLGITHLAMTRVARHTLLHNCRQYLNRQKQPREGVQKNSKDEDEAGDALLAAPTR